MNTEQTPKQFRVEALEFVAVAAVVQDAVSRLRPLVEKHDGDERLTYALNELFSDLVDSGERLVDLAHLVKHQHIR